MEFIQQMFCELSAGTGKLIDLPIVAFQYITGPELGAKKDDDGN
jgi:hypothetical protein